MPALDAARRGPHTDARTGQNGIHPEKQRQRASQRPKPPGWQRPWAPQRPKPLGGQRPPAHQRPREAANTALTPQAHTHQSFFARAMPNKKLVRHMCRRVGALEQKPWWATGTRTEAERQELSGQAHQWSSPAPYREFLPGAGRLENHTTWARTQRRVSRGVLLNGRTANVLREPTPRAGHLGNQGNRI